MTTSSSSPPPKTNTTTLSREATIYLALLALQFGIQPILMQRYAATGIIRSTVVLLQEVTKFLIAGTVLLFQQQQPIQECCSTTMKTIITNAALPAGLYAIQNVSYLMALQTLDPLTFNVLAQTKTLWAALCCYLWLGRTQSQIQLIALLLLLLAALIMEGVVDSILNNNNNTTTNNNNEWDIHLTRGVLPILISTFLSGLAGALSQGALQNRNSYLYSMELCAAQSLILLGSLLVSPDGVMIREQGFWYQWEWATVIPILTGAVGGVLVGLVTKHEGAVYKGFALICGMFLSGVLQSSSVSKTQAVGGILAAVSIFLHATNPPPRDASEQIIKKDL